ncbi:division/cell wall cluster transcriptional repressor MraZ [Butyrivibrio sp. MC2013]|uniref:division/cell wall cluster transcriptional repressor MraZ n=1 Tax=Butyrivibrio sp. MC2013 TaxID=1280686 RepID=UPI0003F4F3D7|nr:division/cell wall cluster transcriptional repressor MraZ [Butyrivibrio sp. MC2013]
MLTGEYSHSIDAKGRLIIPSRIREELGDEFAVTKGLDGCLLLYPEDSWEDFAGRLQALPAATNAAARKVQRFFLGSALTTEFDKQGRILLPAKLLEFAGLSKEAVIVGMGNHAEIWDPVKYEEFNSDDDIDSIAENMGDLGLRF